MMAFRDCCESDMKSPFLFQRASSTSQLPGWGNSVEERGVKLLVELAQDFLVQQAVGGNGRATGGAFIAVEVGEGAGRLQ